MSVLVMNAKFGDDNSGNGCANCGVFPRLTASERKSSLRSPPRLNVRETLALTLAMPALRKGLLPMLPRI